LGLLPCHGLGSGIKRALEGWPDIDFADDREGCLFTATVHRKEQVGSLKSSLKMSGEILLQLHDNPALSIPGVAENLGKSERTIERALRKLRQSDLLKRIGSAKGGYWDVEDRAKDIRK
jgi:ATP-dependent DNA helicase RecG